MLVCFDNILAVGWLLLISYWSFWEGMAWHRTFS